jgi:hypothetical protein
MIFGTTAVERLALWSAAAKRSVDAAFDVAKVIGLTECPYRSESAVDAALCRRTPKKGGGRVTAAHGTYATMT